MATSRTRGVHLDIPIIVQRSRIIGTWHGNDCTDSCCSGTKIDDMFSRLSLFAESSEETIALPDGFAHAYDWWNVTETEEMATYRDCWDVENMMILISSHLASIEPSCPPPVSASSKISTAHFD